MARVQFTKSELNRMLVARSSEIVTRDFIDVTGLTVRHRTTPFSASVSFIFRKRFHGKLFKASIGSYPEIKLDVARHEFERLSVTLRDSGALPLTAKEEKAREQAAQSDLFKNRWAEFMAFKSLQISVLSLKAYQMVQNHLAPVMDLPLSFVTPEIINSKVFAPIIARGKLAALQSVSQKLKAFGEYVTALGALPNNPYSRLSVLLPDYKQEHHPSFLDSELEERMTDLFNRFHEFPQEVQALLHFHFYVPLRSNEVRSLKLADALGADSVTVKTKTWESFTMPLSTQAQKIVQWCASQGRRCYLFEGPRGNKVSSSWVNFYIKKAGVDFVVHSVRSCFMQFMVKQTDIKETVASLCLAHTVGNQTEQAYNRGEYLEERRRAMQLWGDFVEKCVGKNAFY